MTEYLIGVIAAALVNELSLWRLYGLEPVPVLTRLRHAACLAAVTLAATVAAAVLSYALFYAVLSPLGLQSAGIILFLLVAVGVAACAGAIARSGNSEAASVIEAQWPLVALNGVLLGASLYGVSTGVSFAATVLSALGASALFGVSLLALTAIMARMDEDAIPKSVRGLPALLLAAALISMALMAFTGL